MVNPKLALRTLFKTPFVTTVAVLSLALGIGANAAIFSLVDQVILRPLPVRHPERLVNLASPGPKSGSVSCNDAGNCDYVFSYPMFRDLERAPTMFTGIAAHRSFEANVAYHGQTLNGMGMLVSGSYFPLLAVQPPLGRLFGPADDQTIGANFVAVLSYSYWETQLGANPAVLNERIVVNGQPMTIIGVGPKGFEGTTLGTRPTVFVPITMGVLVAPGFHDFTNRRNYWAYLFARLKPGVSMVQAARAVNAVYRPIINEVEVPLQEGISAQRLARFRAKEILIEDGRRGQSEMHEQTRTPLLLLFAITGIVLLSACANIANLLLARAASRSTEMAVRLALGGTRRQLLSQLLTESCLLAALGGVVSLFVAQSTIALLMTLLPADATMSMQFELDIRAVLFAAVLSLGTGVLFGLFPALHSTRPDLASTLRSGSGKVAGERAATRFRTSLVTAQIALSMALLIAAGLFTQSLRNLARINLGMRIDDIVTFGISPDLNGYTPARAKLLFGRVEEELAALPGVTGVSAAVIPILANSNSANTVNVEGFKKGPDTDANARMNEVGPDYFRTLGIPLLAGRDFTAADVASAPRVAIVNVAFTKKFNLGREAVGKHLSVSRKEAPNIEIVGVVRDAKYSEVKGDPPPMYLIPYRQDTTVGSINFYVRSSDRPELLLRTIPAIIKRLDANLPVENLKTMPQQVRDNVFLDRMIGTLSAAFAALATLLAAVGLYGVLAYSVTQRTKEIGVRMALGADRRRVQGMVLRQVGFMTLVGGVIGIAGAVALGRSAGSLLYGLSGQDPVVVAGAALVLVVVALGAGYVPALRASRIDPMHALRYE